MTSPPIKKPTTAIKDGHCRSLRPEIACPEVHPPAYLVPKPINKPPIARMAIFFALMVSKISVGSKLLLHFQFLVPLNLSLFVRKFEEFGCRKENEQQESHQSRNLAGTTGSTSVFSNQI